VRTLRAQQFSEDSGPLAHPVRPTAYREINNFYTSTVYEKGAEVVRMLKTLLGPSDFRKGMDLYLSRCDGTAATVEDFLACFAEASGRDLGAFARWYAQAGTPVVTAQTHYDAAARRFRLDLAQSTPPTPGQPLKEPVTIPVALGLLSRSGAELPLAGTGADTARGLVVLDRASASFVFENVPEEPIPSLLRGFSAPVRLDTPVREEDLLVLLRHDSDPVNRWQAAQSYAMTLLTRAVEAIKRQETPQPDPRFADAVGELVAGSTDHAFTAQVLALPTEADIAREIGTDIDPDAVLAARRALRATVGARIAGVLATAHAKLASDGPYAPDAASAGRRALRNVSLDLLVAGDPARGEALAAAQFEAADNMTDRLAALAALCQVPGERREAALARFAEDFRADPLVLDKWFALQASIPEPATLDRIRGLMRHPHFSMSNPNRLRSLIGSFAMANPSQFHRPDGQGYRLLADIVIELDGTNPQVAARLLGAFKTWRALEPGRRGLAEGELKRIAARPKLSPDVFDIVTRALA
jgi:aminopeptidase N